MAIRRHRAGELVIEQTRDLAQVRATLETAGLATDGIEWPRACYLLAYFGDEPVGVVGIEPIVDVALIRSLYVILGMRRRGVAARLIAAARQAAHTRGSRTLYLFASPELVAFFAKFGFAQVAVEPVIDVLGGAPGIAYLRAHPEEMARARALALDISQDGVIAR